MIIQAAAPPPQTVQVQFGFAADLRCAENETRRGRSFGFAPAFPSAARSYQALTFYPALTYGVDGDQSTGPILGFSASAIAAFLASSTVLKSPVYVASKAGIMPGPRGLAK